MLTLLLLLCMHPQALWQANGGIFHRDLSPREAEAARHSVEHLLHLQRQQRATLRQAAVAASALEAASTIAVELRASGALPPASAARAWLWRAKSAVDAACDVAGEAAVLLKGLLAVECAEQQRDSLPAAAAAAVAAAAALSAAQAQMLRSCFTPQLSREPSVVQLPDAASHPVLVMPSMLADVAAALSLGSAHVTALQAAVPHPDGLPGWSALLASLTALRSLLEEHATEAALWSAAAAAPHGQGLSSAFAADADKLLAEVLLWAQGMHAAAGATGAAAASAEDPDVPAPSNAKINDWTASLDKQLASARLAGIGERFLALCRDVAALTDAADPSAKAAAATLGALAPPLRMVSAAAARVAADYVALNKSTAKLCGTLAGVFSGLARDGFCAPPEETEVDGAGDKLLDDQAGTGIGAGEGKKDVSDEIEDEAQVLGMEDLEKDETAAQPPPGDKSQGLEMGTDFEGEKHELEHDEEDEEDDRAPEKEADQLDKEVRAPRMRRLGCAALLLSGWARAHTLC
jgi:midasin